MTSHTRSETARRPRGITTRYRSQSFRSRLEARWAAFFDLVDWSWVYEPLDADGWIPDFLIAGRAPFLVEVGPCLMASEFSSKAAKALAAFPPVADGQPPERITLVLGVGPLALPDAKAGYLTDDGMGSGTDFGDWAYCPHCQHLAVYHGSGSRTFRPCGHGTDDRYREPAADRPLNDLWSTAGNLTQWRGRRAA